MDTSLGNRVEKAMLAAGIKARSFAALVGCHYTTIYDLVKNPEVIPLRIMQERIYEALDFLDDSVKHNRLPINDPKKGVAEKTRDLERMFHAYKQKEMSQSN